MPVALNPVEPGRRRWNGATRSEALRDADEAGCQRDIGSQPQQIRFASCYGRSAASHPRSTEVMGPGSLDAIDDLCQVAARSPTERQLTGGSRRRVLSQRLGRAQRHRGRHDTDNRRSGNVQTVEIMVGPGAAEVVAPRTFVAEYKSKSSAGFRSAPRTGFPGGTWSSTRDRRELA